MGRGGVNCIYCKGVNCTHQFYIRTRNWFQRLFRFGPRCVESLVHDPRACPLRESHPIPTTSVMTHDQRQPNLESMIEIAKKVQEVRPLANCFVAHPKTKQKIQEAINTPGGLKNIYPFQPWSVTIMACEHIEENVLLPMKSRDDAFNFMKVMSNKYKLPEEPMYPTEPTFPCPVWFRNDTVFMNPNTKLMTNICHNRSCPHCTTNTIDDDGFLACGLLQDTEITLNDAFKIKHNRGPICK